MNTSTTAASDHGRDRPPADGLSPARVTQRTHYALDVLLREHANAQRHALLYESRPARTPVAVAVTHHGVHEAIEPIIHR